MKLQVLLACFILIIPGCFSKDSIDYNGTELDGMKTFKFTLSDQNQSLNSLEDSEGKVVVLAFVYTRCDDVCLLISKNLKVVKSQLTSEEQQQVSFISITIDWRHDSPEVLKNWSSDMGLDWPHLTDWNSDEIRNTYSAYDVVPYDEEDYQEIHLQPVYILDSKLNGQVVWNEYDWPVDLFIEDLRTVINLE
tara:strand:+ start:6574 stop:7149 length:576 start_codon:yes stop_codon:yes gene_type:complete